MDAAAERREQADAPVTDLVDASLDDNVTVIGDGAGGGLVVEIPKQDFGRMDIEIVLADETIDRGGPRHRTQVAHEAADCVSELDWAARLVAVPERHLAWFAGSGRDEDAVVRNLVDPPRGGAEREGLAGMRFEDHLLVELTHTRGLAGAGS